MNKINFPVKYALMPIKEYDSIISNFIVKNIRTSAYAVSKCYLVEDSTVYDMDGNSKKNYKVIFPYAEVFLSDEFNYIKNDFSNLNITISKVDEVFDDYISAKEKCDIINQKFINKETSSKEFNSFETEVYEAKVKKRISDIETESMNLFEDKKVSKKILLYGRN